MGPLERVLILHLRFRDNTMSTTSKTIFCTLYGTPCYTLEGTSFHLERTDGRSIPHANSVYYLYTFSLKGVYGQIALSLNQLSFCKESSLIEGHPLTFFPVEYGRGVKIFYPYFGPYHICYDCGRCYTSSVLSGTSFSSFGNCCPQLQSEEYIFNDGGTPPGTPPYASFLSLEANQDISNRYKSMFDWCFARSKLGKSFLSQYLAIPDDAEMIVDFIEDLSIFLHHVLISRNTFDRGVALAGFAKARGSRFGFTTTIFVIASDIFGTYVSEELFGDDVELQSEDIHVNTFAQMRSYVNMWETLKNTTIWRKIHKFMMYALTINIFGAINVTFDSLKFDDYSQKCIKRTHQPGIDMVVCFIDTILFVLERGAEFAKTGKISEFFHSGGSFEHWMKKCYDLKLKASFLGDPETHNINMYEYTASVRECLTRGEHMVLQSSSMDKWEAAEIKRLVNDLKMIQGDLVSRKAAQTPREDPFCVLVHGNSKICKSQFQTLMFYHLGKCQNLPTDDSFKYVKNLKEDFWSGFNSSMWCLVLDDVAYLNPASGPDTTLDTFLNVKNETPFTPEMAHLDDKGKTPFRGIFITGSTNNKHLNLASIYNCPFAIARRIDFMIDLKVKPEYRSRYNEVVDPDKIPAISDGEYMNIWIIEVQVAKLIQSNATAKQHFMWETVANFTDIYEYLAWLGKQFAMHREKNSKSAAANKSMQLAEVCSTCCYLTNRCQCRELQSETYQEPWDYIPPAKFWFFDGPKLAVKGLWDTFIRMETLPARLIFDYIPEWRLPYTPLEVDLQGMNDYSYDKSIEDYVGKLDVFTRFKLGVLRNIIQAQPLDMDLWNMFYFKWFAILSLFVDYMTTSYYIYYIVFTWLLVLALLALTKYSWVILHYFVCYVLGPYWKIYAAKQAFGHPMLAASFLFHCAGAKVSHSLSTPMSRRLLRFLNTEKTALLMAISGILYFTRGQRKPAPSKKTSRGGLDDVDYYLERVKAKPSSGTLFRQHAMEFQADSTPQPHAVEKPTFYYHDEYKLTTLDISPASMNVQHDELQRRLERNTCRLIFRYKNHPVPGTCSSTTALCIVGNLFIFNHHAMKGEDCTVDVIFESRDINVSRNAYGVVIDSSSMKFIKHDLMCLYLPQVSGGKSLMAYFPLNRRIPCQTKGKYFMINKEGHRSQKIINNIKLDSCIINGEDVPAYSGVTDQPTVIGDSGSPCLSLFGNAQVILGIHAGRQGGKVLIIALNQEDIRMCISQFPQQMSVGSLPIGTVTKPRKLKPVTKNHALRYVKGQGEIFGEFNDFMGKAKSKVAPSYIRDQAVAEGYNANFGSPDLSWRPQRVVTEALVDQSNAIPPKYINLVRDAYLADILTSIELEQITEMEPYSLDVALNGVPGVTYVDRINLSTSAGNPYKQSKRFHMSTDEEGRIVEVDEEILQRIDDMEAAYDREERYHAQFCAHYKDEPLPQAKIDNHKTRVFTSGEVAFSLCVRKYYLPLIRLIQNNSYSFEAMPGVVAQSEEWHTLYNYITHFGADKIIAGDYKAFDKTMRAVMIINIFSVYIELAKRARYTERDIRIMWGIAFDIAYPCVELFGVLLEIQQNPSGNPLTVIINCTGNSFYMRLALCQLIVEQNPGHPDIHKLLKINLAKFQTNVHLATYGDDNIMGVSAGWDWFNHTAIARALSVYGITYTMAEKDEDSVPYIHINDATFLKRKFRIEGDLCFAPLDASSFDKMLTTRLVKSELSAEGHAIRVIETAQREYFEYGEGYFLEKQNVLKRIAEKADLSDWYSGTTFPTYQSLLEDRAQRSSALEKARNSNRCVHIHMDPDGKPVITPRAGLSDPHVCNLDSQHTQGSDSRERVTSSLQGLNSGEEARLKFLPSECLSHDEVLCLQSEAYVETNGKPVITEKVLVDFIDSNVAPPVGLAASNNTFSTGDKTHQTDLKHFFSRPVRIQSFTWNETDTIGKIQTFSVWSDWANNTYIKSKLNNFAWFRGNLKIKIQLTASPFYYGLLQGVYQPLPNLTPSTIVNDAGTRYLIPVSQRPHVKMEPGKVDSCEMTLPFFFHKNWASIQSLAEITGLGTLEFYVYSMLRSANGVTGNGISVVLYAWVDDIELSGASVGLALQSETFTDEYGQGTISKPASWVAKAATYFENIPVIGRFATATKIGASAVGAIAGLFGFTNVPVIADTLPYRPEAFPKLASSEIAFPVEKLTIDPKNELSVDPRIVGLPGTDEMNLQYLAGRESWLTRINWANTDNVDSILFYCRVNPKLYDNDGATNSKLYMTPSAWVVNAFNEWRGEVHFKLKIICSHFHKGRLIVSYDPAGYNAANIGNVVSSSNVVFTKIIDIGETQEVDIAIPYQQATQFLAVRSAINTSNMGWAVKTAVPGTYPYEPNYDNGFLTIRVLNTLTSPVVASNIDIQVYTYTKDLVVANPTELEYPQMYNFAPQSETFLDASCDQNLSMGETSRNDDNQFLVHYGENIQSIRQLMHRYQLVSTDSWLTTATPDSMTMCTKFFYKIPPAPGYISTAYRTANQIIGTGTANYNWTNTTWLTYFSPAFIAYRGSVNWTFNMNGIRPAKSLRVIKDNYNGSTANVTTTQTFTMNANKIAASIITRPAGATASALTSQLTNAGINVVCPMYTRFKFQSTNPANANRGIIADGSLRDGFILEYMPEVTSTSNASDFYLVDSYCATGVDYSLHFFLNVPVFYIYGTTPTPN